MNNRERFFRLLENKPIDRVPFFPDISTWYENTRKVYGEEEIFGPGVYIPDDSDFHSRESLLQGDMSKMTMLDYYREYDWGLPVHIYQWFDTKYSGGVEVATRVDNKRKTITYNTPRGTLYRTYILDHDGSWAPLDHLIKDPDEFDILKYILEHSKHCPRFEPVEKFLRETDGFGICDLVISRSPFGKLVHEYLGFQELVYALADDEQLILDFLEVQEYYDMKIIELAASSPARLVIISDHADENLISPPFYNRYCMPFYKKACNLLHASGKFVSTHLDGNIKGYMNLLGDTGFDLLDGCTPSPMFNYEPEDLASAIKGKLSCYMGIPASMFVDGDGTGTDEVTGFGQRIVQAFDGRVIVNVGDILPPDGDIHKVIAAGKEVMKTKW